MLMAMFIKVSKHGINHQKEKKIKTEQSGSLKKNNILYVVIYQLS